MACGHIILSIKSILSTSDTNDCSQRVVSQRRLDFNFHERVVTKILLLTLFICFYQSNSNNNFKKNETSGKLKKKKLKPFKVIQSVWILHLRYTLNRYLLLKHLDYFLKVYLCYIWYSNQEAQISAIICTCMPIYPWFIVTRGIQSMTIDIN